MTYQCFGENHYNWDVERLYRNDGMKHRKTTETGARNRGDMVQSSLGQ
jgi:hypothetical protein